MTRKYYLSRNGLTRQYCLDDGNYGSRRKVLGKDKDFVLSYLRKAVDKKRKSDFFLIQEDLFKEEIIKISKFFSESKVNVNLESKVNL